MSTSQIPTVYSLNGVLVMEHVAVRKFMGRGDAVADKSIIRNMKKNASFRKTLIGCPKRVTEKTKFDDYTMGWTETAVHLGFPRNLGDRKKGIIEAFLAARMAAEPLPAWPPQPNPVAEPEAQEERCAFAPDEAADAIEPDEPIQPDAAETEPEPGKNLIPTRFDVAGCHLEVLSDLDAEAFWWTQAQMAEAFGLDVRTISHHIDKIFASGELREGPSVIQYYRITAADGKAYRTAHYSLDMFLLVGGRARATERTIAFRKKANAIIKDHITKRHGGGQSQEITTLVDRMNSLTTDVSNLVSRFDHLIASVNAMMVNRQSAAASEMEQEQLRPQRQPWPGGRTRSFKEFRAERKWIPEGWIHRFLSAEGINGDGLGPGLIEKDKTTNHWVCTRRALEADPRLLTNVTGVVVINGVDKPYAAFTMAGAEHFSQLFHEMNSRGEIHKKGQMEFNLDRSRMTAED